EESTELQLFENGELDWVGDPTGSVPLAAIQSMKDNDELEISDRAGLYYYSFNHDEEPFNNENIRKAFALALDRQSIIDSDTQGEGDYEVGRMGWIADFNDAINFIELFESVGGNNYTNWEDDEYKKLVKESRTELDPDKREEILKEAEELFMDQMVISPVYF